MNLTRSKRSQEGHPTWSPDGARIAFTSDRDGDMELYLMNADGTQLRRLSDNRGADGLPTFSPDGKRIVYVSERNGNHDLYRIDEIGGLAMRLTDAPGLDTMPAWSPDGETIAFVSDRDGSQGIYLMDPDGRNVRRLSRKGAFDAWPTWTHDGRIVFQSMRDGNFEIYLMNAALGASAERLTRHRASDRNPRVLPLFEPAAPPAAAGARRWTATVRGSTTSGAGPNPQKYPFQFTATTELTADEWAALTREGALPQNLARKFAALLCERGADDEVKKAELAASAGKISGQVSVLHRDGTQGTRTITALLTGKISDDGLSWTVERATVKGTWDWGGGVAELNGEVEVSVRQERAPATAPRGHP